MSSRAPLTYDEIARHTVPDPDGFVHPDPPPTEAELRLDNQIRAAISDALIANAIDTLGFEVHRGRVILHGWARDLAAASRIERIITEAAPDAVIDNRMQIAGS